MSERFVPAVDPPPVVVGEAWWFAFRDGELLVAEPTTGAAIPVVTDLAALGLNPVRRQYLGTLAGRPGWSAELGAGTEPPPGFTFRGLRELHGRLDETVWGVAGRAAQIVAWDRDHAFCGRCGA
ncbi:MAG: NADH pyrophosphatase, partial [Chloroflexota bacterium]|nr:NADH pyrophosphatase [Chloroflexota bacterium]